MCACASGEVSQWSSASTSNSWLTASGGFSMRALRDMPSPGADPSPSPGADPSCSPGADPSSPSRPFLSGVGGLSCASISSFVRRVTAWVCASHVPTRRCVPSGARRLDEYTAPDLRSSRISLPSITMPSTLSTPWWTRRAFAVFGTGTAMPSSESEPSSSPEPTPSSLSCGNRSRSCLRRSSRARFAAVFLARRCAALPPPPGEAAAGEEFPFAFATPFALPAEVPAAARSGSESESLNLSRSSSLIARVSRCSPPGAPSTRLVEWRGPSRKISQLCATAAGAPRDGVIFYPPSSRATTRVAEAARELVKGTECWRSHSPRTSRRFGSRPRSGAASALAPARAWRSGRRPGRRAPAWRASTRASRGSARSWGPSRRRPRPSPRSRRRTRSRR